MIDQFEDQRKAEEALNKMGVEVKIEEGKYIFYLTAPLIVDNGLRFGEKLSSSGLDAALSIFLGKYSGLIYRACEEKDLGQLLQRGVDETGVQAIVGQKQANEIFASRYLEKATEYGHGPMKILGEQIAVDQVTVLMYDPKKMLDLGSFKFSFRQDPREALLGILVLQNQQAGDSK